MINHTMIVSFDQPLPATIPIPGEEAIPALIATAIVQVALADPDALAKAFAAPGIGEVIDRWQSRYPYKVGWANHEPMS